MKKDSKKIYITTTLPYVNSDPHIGFALEIVQADIIARHKKLMGYEVFFNTGTDEHGSKIYQKAMEQKKDPQQYVDEYAAHFRDLKGPLGLSDDINFVRTTDSRHVAAVQEFWRRCAAAGDIYKKKYKTKYCIGCELEKTDSELVDGKCPIHPHMEIEIREEDNYFFRFSKYTDFLSELYKRTDFVVPDARLNELRSFIKEKGLEDFSISRLKSKMPWGVDVPDDAEQVMYVWFDAFVNYISAIGWPTDMEKFNNWWMDTGGVVQFAGKDQVRQQAAMWQAMLKSVGLPPSREILIHGFINSGGQKMSKSLGNVISPYDLVNEYGTDALRYFLSRDISFFEDSDVTPERLKESYNANLANGIGNLTSRIMKMAETHLAEPVTIPEKTLPQEYLDYLDTYDIKKAADLTWKHIAELDRTIQEQVPFKVVKTDKVKGEEIIRKLVVDLYTVARMLNVLMPTTSAVIKACIKANKMPEKSLFVRKE